MKKIVSLLLALLMLCGCLSLFAACSPETDGVVVLEGSVEGIDLSTYKLYYGASQSGSDYTATYQGQLSAFAEELSAATGEKITARDISRATAVATDKEILLGLTTRDESRAALAQIEGEGFIIKVTDSKIVIAGTDNLFTLMGMQYFVKKYLTDHEKGTPFTLHETAVASSLETVVLADSAKNGVADAQDAYTYVIRHGLASLPSAYAATGSGSANSTYKEYPQIALESVNEKVQALTGLGGKFFPTDTDKNTHDKEVLIGRTVREESANALAEIEGDQYIIKTVGSKVVVNAWSESALKVAVAAYMDVMIEAKREGETGNKLLVLPQNFSITGHSNPNWVLEFPKPAGEGINLYNTMDANDNALQFLYTGTGVNATSYKAYCDLLKREGYEIYMRNEAEGSIFTTFRHLQKEISLYVAYNAYAHKDNFSEYNWALSKSKTGDKGVYQYDPCFRIVSAPLSSAWLPEEKLLTKQSYQKVTESAVTTMPIYGKAVGLSYVVTLEDGSFIVFDGGGVNTDGTEHETLWKVLSKMHTKIYGQAPSQANPVRIAGWVLTHAHWDHYYAFQQMAKLYGSTGVLKMDYMIANIPAVDSAYTIRSIADDMTPDRVKSLQGMFKDSFRYIKVHTGQKFFLANVEIEVITTWEDLNPLVPNNTNDTNTVLRFSVYNQSKPNAAPVTQMWTGDANRWQSRFMCATFGPYLKSDMVSVAHHGNAGCEVEFYAMVAPTAVWWPHNAASVKNYLNTDKKNKDWRHQVDQYLCNDMECVKYIYTSGIPTQGDSFYTTLTIGQNGPEYDGIVDLMTGEALAYSGISGGCIKK